MTRGKYTQKAETRKAIAEAEMSAETYQHAVRRLTAENQALKAKLDDQTKAHWREVKKLKAERDEGLSPHLRVLEQESRKHRESAENERRAADQLGRMLTKVFTQLIKHAQSEHQLATSKAMEFVSLNFPELFEAAAGHARMEAVVSQERRPGYTQKRRSV